jgi:methylated-DNA-protein-cysteine methyltransferase-like protein
LNRQTFYEQVYDFVRGVPPGRVVTYGQVALELGAPSAARSVGYALFFLPGDSDVPWWRVINVRGGISLRNRGEAADMQRRLLEGEGVRFDANDRTELGRYRWWPNEDGNQLPESFDPGA